VPHCLRRVDGTKTVADVEGEVHADGEIWSRALWDIRTALGDTEANRIIINAQFSFKADTSFADPAVRITQLANQFGSNGIVASICTNSLAAPLQTIAQAIVARLTP